VVLHSYIYIIDTHRDEDEIYSVGIFYSMVAVGWLLQDKHVNLHVSFDITGITVPCSKASSPKYDTSVDVKNICNTDGLLSGLQCCVILEELI